MTTLAPEARQKLKDTLKTLEAVEGRKRFHRALFFTPYPKQREFFDLGTTKRERLLIAGNQVGKSEAGAFECAVHASGEYPPWWKGRRYQRPVRIWAAGVTSLDVRNIQQRKLVGTPGVVADHGTGYLPRAAIVDYSLARGVTDAIDTIQVRHKTFGKEDGVSTIHFKSYEQGRAKFQGDTIDVGWADEEPEKMEIYSEFLARLRGDGILFTTFTPLFGKTDLVKRFTEEAHDDRGLVTMTLDDAEHFTADEKKKRYDGYLKHERDARALGVPMLGSGRIFTYDEEFIKEEPIASVPTHWAKLWGIDFGIGHPFAAVLVLWDRDNDVIHVHSALRIADGLPINHAAAMKPIGIDVPVAWPQDGTAREKGSGEDLASLYRRQGLAMLAKHATWEDGGLSTEAGLLEMDQRFQSGRLKVARHLSDWFEEYRNYHRKDGQIVKVRDDLMSATRVAVMMKRAARAVLLGGKSAKAARAGMERMCEGVDFDPHLGI
jgi:phage terminase large subunit-like protein